MSDLELTPPPPSEKPTTPKKDSLCEILSIDSLPNVRNSQSTPTQHNNKIKKIKNRSNTPLPTLKLQRKAKPAGKKKVLLSPSPVPRLRQTDQRKSAPSQTLPQAPSALVTSTTKTAHEEKVLVPAVPPSGTLLPPLKPQRKAKPAEQENPLPGILPPSPLPCLPRVNTRKAAPTQTSPQVPPASLFSTTKTAPEETVPLVPSSGAPFPPLKLQRKAKPANPSSCNLPPLPVLCLPRTNERKPVPDHHPLGNNYYQCLSEKAKSPH